MVASKAALRRDRGLAPVDGAQVCTCSDPSPPDSCVCSTISCHFLNQRLMLPRPANPHGLAEKRSREVREAGHAALLVCTHTHAGTPHANVPHGHPAAVFLVTPPSLPRARLSPPEVRTCPSHMIVAGAEVTRTGHEQRVNDGPEGHGDAGRSCRRTRGGQRRGARAPGVGVRGGSPLCSLLVWKFWSLFGSGALRAWPVSLQAGRVPSASPSCPNSPPGQRHRLAAARQGVSLAPPCLHLSVSLSLPGGPTSARTLPPLRVPPFLPSLPAPPITTLTNSSRA